MQRTNNHDNNIDKKDTDSQEATPTSIAAIKAQFEANKADDASPQKALQKPTIKQFQAFPRDHAPSENSQQNTVKEELARLRLERLKQLTEDKSDMHTQNPTTSQKAADELKGYSLNASKARLFSQQTQPAKNPKNLEIAKELQQLASSNVSNVQSKAILLNKYFEAQTTVLKEIEENATSAKAKNTLQPQQHDVFINQQKVLIADVKKNMKEDMRQFAETDMVNGNISFVEFLKLSFAYRSYQVCLEQEFRRHAAQKIESSNIKSKSNEISFLCAIPNKMAIQSLNYYFNFFENLGAIEKFWPNAGAEIRRAEMKILFIAKHTDPNILFLILCDTNRDYQTSCDEFETSFMQYIKRNPSLLRYIDSGNGLDSKNHPWVLNSYSRLAQPNATIDFSKFVPIDLTQAQAVAEIEDRMKRDSVKMARK